MRYGWRLWVAVLAASGLLCAPTASYAAGSPSWAYRQGGGTMNTPTMQKDKSPGILFDLLPDGNLKASGALPATIGTLGTAAMTWARMTPHGRAALFFGPVIAGALSNQVLDELAALIRCRKKTGEPVVECDPGMVGSEAPPTAAYACRFENQNPASYRESNISMNDCATKVASWVSSVVPAGAPCYASGLSITCTGPGYGYFGMAVGVTPLAGSGSVCPVGVRGFDGRCASGNFDPASNEQIRAKLTDYPSIAPQVRDASDDILRRGFDGGLDLSGAFDNPPVVTGPPKVIGSPTTTTSTQPDGTPGPTTTTTPEASITYEGPSFTWNTTTTTTTTNGGTTTTTGPAQKIETCGLPGTPACKIDEEGTPDPASLGTTPSREVGPLTPAVNEHANKINEVAGSIVTPSFGFFGAPPVAECTPFEFPERPGPTGGVIQLPPIDPCGVVGGVRGVMAFLWALAGGWLIISMIRRAVGTS